MGTISFSLCTESEALVQRNDTRGFRVAVLPLRRQFVQPAHFEHLVTRGTVEAGVGRNIRHGVGHRICRLRVHVALVRRGVLLRRQRVSLVQSRLGHNGGALVHGGVFTLVRAADNGRRRHVLFGYLQSNCLFPVGTRLKLILFRF